MAINELAKSLGVTNAMLAKSIANAKLSNSSEPITPPPMMPQAPQVLGDALSDKNRQLAIMLYGLGSAFKGQDPLQAGLGLQQSLQKQQEMKPIFPGQSMTNQFMNVLLQGQQDESIRSTPIYKTAYDFLSQQKTETYINELGQSVTRTLPSIIQEEDYLPPIGFDFDAKPEEKQSEVVQELTPERRETLTTNIDTLNNTLVKLENFEQALDEIQPGVFTFGEERAKIKSLHTSILLELKNLERLGVLAGPDLDLLLNMLGDPTSFQQTFMQGGVAGTKIQIQNIKNTIAEKKNRFNKELGIETQDIQPKEPTEAYLNGRKIILNADKTAWIYEDTREPAE